MQELAILLKRLRRFCILFRASQLQKTTRIAIHKKGESK